MIALGVLLLSCFYDFSIQEYAVLVLLFGVVISAEMFNTAIERVIDYLSPSYNNLAKLVKDIAAGAVLICAISAIIIGFLFFYDFTGFGNIWAFMTKKPAVFAAGVAAYILLAINFVFLPEKKR